MGGLRTGCLGQIGNIIRLLFSYYFMVNLGSTDDSRYTGYREITDRDVLDLQCI